MELVRRFSFSNPTRIIFGVGKVSELPLLVKGIRICVVTTPGFTRRGMSNTLLGLFGERLVAVIDRVEPNPDLDTLDRLIAEVRRLKPDAILALGGGSAMDSGKIIAKALTAPSGWTLNGHFRNKEPMHGNAPLACYAVPTTSGTGAEVTPFATVWDGLKNVKYSLASPDMFPVAAILDPALTLDMPREVTVSTGLDAISQALESVWNRSCNEITLAWAISALRLGLHSLLKAADQPDDVEARAEMAQASMLAGLCISHTRTALAHSISYPITAHYGLPHGLACSFTLPALFIFNAAVDDGRLHNVATALGYEDIMALRAAVLTLLLDVGVGRYLRHYVPSTLDLIKHVPEMITPNRADNNLRPVSLAEVEDILRQAIADVF